MKCQAAIAVIVFTLAARGNIQTVRSFSTQYQQPTEGERARIRVISDGMIRAVPNSTCIDWRLPGAGVMIAAKKGFAQSNDQKLDMPIGLAVDKPAKKDLAISETAFTALSYAIYVYTQVADRDPYSHSIINPRP